MYHFTLSEPVPYHLFRVDAILELSSSSSSSRVERKTDDDWEPEVRELTAVR